MRHDATIRVALLDELIKTWIRKATEPFDNCLEDSEAGRIKDAEDKARNKALKECAGDLEGIVVIYTD